MEKQCIYCGLIYYKNKNHSLEYFLNKKKYCSYICSVKNRKKGDINYSKNYYERTRVERLEKQRKYRDTEHYRNINKNYQKNLREKQPILKKHQIYHSLISYFFKKQNGHSKRLMQDLGYNVNDLISHFSSLFLPQMSYSNYGEWEIDHIIPKSKFDEKTLRECWSLNNLRPIWRLENRLKNKYIK